MTVKERSDTRDKILRAAEALAHEIGPGRLSLDAVAARAGVSKGGLLYHFPSKAALMEALVSEFCGQVDAALCAAEAEGRRNAVLDAYIAAFVDDRCRHEPPPTGLLAALAEDPGLLDPVREQERNFLDRIRANADDPDLATLAFLVVNGVRSMELLNVRVVTASEFEAVIAYLRERLDRKS